nr:DNA topoisomerase I [Tanacetum cinerariifolium]
IALLEGVEREKHPIKLFIDVVGILGRIGVDAAGTALTRAVAAPRANYSGRVIVESPAKAKTIEGYLGADFVVRSSYGHVRDLPKDNNAVDIANGFKPTYVVDADKRELISQLKKLAKEAETVWLASDDDREGEAISWHLSETLNLKADKTKR